MAVNSIWNGHRGIHCTSENSPLAMMNTFQRPCNVRGTANVHLNVHVEVEEVGIMTLES